MQQRFSLGCTIIARVPGGAVNNNKNVPHFPGTRPRRPSEERAAAADVFVNQSFFHPASTGFVEKRSQQLHRKLAGVVSKLHLSTTTTWLLPIARVIDTLMRFNVLAVLFFHLVFIFILRVSGQLVGRHRKMNHCPS